MEEKLFSKSDRKPKFNDQRVKRSSQGDSKGSQIGKISMNAFENPQYKLDILINEFARIHKVPKIGAICRLKQKKTPHQESRLEEKACQIPRMRFEEENNSERNELRPSCTIRLNPFLDSSVEQNKEPIMTPSDLHQIGNKTKEKESRNLRKVERSNSFKQLTNSFGRDQKREKVQKSDNSPANPERGNQSLWSKEDEREQIENGEKHLNGQRIKNIPEDERQKRGKNRRVLNQSLKNSKNNYIYSVKEDPFDFETLKVPSEIPENEKSKNLYKSKIIYTTPQTKYRDHKDEEYKQIKNRRTDNWFFSTSFIVEEMEQDNVLQRKKQDEKEKKLNFFQEYFNNFIERLDGIDDGDDSDLESESSEDYFFFL